MVCRSFLSVDRYSSSPSATIDAICATGRMMISSRRRIGIPLEIGRLRRRLVPAIALVTCALFGDDFCVFDAFLRPIERLAQAGFIDRLQQVVDRVHLECAHRIFVVGGHERDQRQVVLLEQAHHADAVKLRHLQIQQRQIRPFPLDRRQGLLARLGLGHHHDVFEGAQERGEKRSRRPFIVGDDDAETGAHDAFLVAAKAAVALVSAGMRISTVVPAFGALPIDS